MIAAQRRPWLARYLTVHISRRLRRSFAALHLHGAEALRRAAREHPLLIVVNHTSWWDGLVLVYLTRRVLELDGYALMDAANLRALPFFGALGAFGLDLQSPQDVAAGLRYAAGLLDRPGRVVWVFPQGREQPSGTRPLGFRRGAARIAQLAPESRVVPMALRYELGPVERPLLYVSFGAALPPALTSLPGAIEQQCAAQEAGVIAELDRIERALRLDASAADPAFERLWLHRPGWAARAALALLCRATRGAGASRPRAGDG